MKKAITFLCGLALLIPTSPVVADITGDISTFNGGGQTYVDSPTVDDFKSNVEDIAADTHTAQTEFNWWDIAYFGGDTANDGAMYSSVVLSDLDGGETLDYDYQMYWRADSGDTWMNFQNGSRSITVGTHGGGGTIHGWLEYGMEDGGQYWYGVSTWMASDGAGFGDVGNQYRCDFDVVVSSAGHELFNQSFSTGELDIIPEPATGLLLLLGSTVILRRRH